MSAVKLALVWPRMPDRVLASTLPVSAWVANVRLRSWKRRSGRLFFQESFSVGDKRCWDLWVLLAAEGSGGSRQNRNTFYGFVIALRCCQVGRFFWFQCRSWCHLSPDIQPFPCREYGSHSAFFFWDRRQTTSVRRSHSTTGRWSVPCRRSPSR